MNEEERIQCKCGYGPCDRCSRDRQLIYAFDDRVYEGGVCSECFLGGKACDLSIEDPLMRPMLFIARALRGDEPFKSILLKYSKKMNLKLIPNNKCRRVQAAIDRRARRRACKARKKALKASKHKSTYKASK